MDEDIIEALRIKRARGDGLSFDEAEYLWAEVDRLRLSVAALRATQAPPPLVDMTNAGEELDNSETPTVPEGRRLPKSALK